MAGYNLGISNWLRSLREFLQSSHSASLFARRVSGKGHSRQLSTQVLSLHDDGCSEASSLTKWASLVCTLGGQWLPSLWAWIGVNNLHKTLSTNCLASYTYIFSLTDAAKAIYGNYRRKAIAKHMTIHAVLTYAFARIILLTPKEMKKISVVFSYNKIIKHLFSVHSNCNSFLPGLDQDIQYVKLRLDSLLAGTLALWAGIKNNSYLVQLLWLITPKMGKYQHLSPACKGGAGSAWLRSKSFCMKVIRLVFTLGFLSNVWWWEECWLSTLSWLSGRCWHGVQIGIGAAWCVQSSIKCSLSMISKKSVFHRKPSSVITFEYIQVCAVQGTIVYNWHVGYKEWLMCYSITILTLTPTLLGHRVFVFQDISLLSTNGCWTISLLSHLVNPEDVIAQ